MRALRARRCLARWVSRCCVALALILQIVYTPIHVYLEPHSEDAEFAGSAPLAFYAMIIGEEDHDGDEHHERHPAAQHQLKGTQATRAPLAEALPVQAPEWMSVESDCAQPSRFEFSGLSPPELPRSWQFIFRAALPVRAPSLTS